MGAVSTYDWATKSEVVKKYMLLGNMRLISELMDIPYDTLMDWKKQDWWQNLVDEIRKARKTKQNNKLTSIIEESLEVVQDRINNGDFILNQKTGEIQRKPVSLRDAANVTNNLISRQLQLEELADKLEHRHESVDETLAVLAREFAKWSKKELKKQVIDVDTVEVKE